MGCGLFGLYAALVLARRGESVLLVDGRHAEFSGASYVNQARVHTGLHYPRSVLTATAALHHYGQFRARFGPAVKDFRHLYAVSSWDTRTDVAALSAHARRLDLHTEPVDPDLHFHPGTVQGALLVEEPSFDADTLRRMLMEEIADEPTISLRLGCRVTRLRPSATGCTACFDDGTEAGFDGVVLAAYAGLNSLRAASGLALLPLKFELAEVVLGTFPEDLADLGVTMLDGAFWSFMPFGHTGLVSLTSVGLTPMAHAAGLPAFPCQRRHPFCAPERLDACGDCEARPDSAWRHQVRQMGRHFRRAPEFRFERSLLTVKTVLQASEVDDARPTLVRKEDGLPVWTVLSGKVSTVFDLEEQLR